MIANLSSIFVMGVFSIGLYMLYFLLILLRVHRIKRLEKVMGSLKKILMFNYILRYFLESYIEFFINALLNLKIVFFYSFMFCLGRLGAASSHFLRSFQHRDARNLSCLPSIHVHEAQEELRDDWQRGVRQ